MRFAFAACLLAVFLAPAWAQKSKKKSKAGTKPLYTSPTITKDTPGKSTQIRVDITGAKQLWLKVDEQGDFSFDHADWAEPRLIGPSGTKKLTELKWKEASAGWGKVGINKSVAGSAMKIDGKPVSYGIGTHAPSLIGFDLPDGYTTFEARIGLDDSGTQQAGAKSSVKFLVYTAKPKAAAAAAAGEGADHVPLELFKTHGDLEISLWATSPLFSNPTNMDIDYKGRIWVAEGRRYRRLAGKYPEGDKIVVLEDTDHDGKADSSHVFVQEPALVAPLGVAVIDNKIIVSQPPDLIVYTDVDRDAKFDPSKDKREVLLTGFDGKNHDHSLHSLTAGPSGQWYFNFGNKGGHVKDKDGWELKAGSPYSMKNIAGKPSSDGHVYLGGTALRVNPDGTGMRPIGHNFRNSYEQTVTSYGDVFQNDNDDPPAARTAWLMEYGNAGYASNDGKRSWRNDKRWGQSTPIAEWRQEDPGSMPAGDVYGGGAPTGITFYESGALGDKYRGLLLSCEPTRNTIFGYLPTPDGAGFKLERFIFLTTNPEGDFAGADFRRGKMGRLNTLFRPSDVTVGPDGAIYVADWFDARVGGHATHDKGQTGTIYRIAPKGAKLTIPTFDPGTLEGLITAFKSHAINVRNIGFVGLRAQGAKALPAVKALLSDPNPYIQARAVWLLAQMGELGLAEVEKRLGHTDPQMRIVAFRALRFVGHDMLKHAAKLAKDKTPAVRREVALAMRNLSLAQCKDILLDVAKGYDGKDRWYLEAFGTGCSGKEAAMYEAVKAELKPGAPARWDDRFAGIAWRLHPATAIEDLAARAKAGSIPFEKRKTALVPIGLTPTMSAVSAMVEVAKNGPEDSAAEARRWIDKQQKGLWARFDPKGVLTGKKTPKLTYTDAIVPKHLGQEVKLPSIDKILSLKGNAKAGKTLAARCVMCHSINGTGVAFGPALSAWGKGQPRQVIAKAIVDPDADIAHGFEGTEIKTKDGKTLQGFVTAEGDLVVIRVFGGRQVAVDAKDIASRTKVEGSFMVPAGKMGLTAQNVRDLVEYLKTGG